MTTRTTCADHAVLPWLQAAADPENFLTGVRKGVPFQVPAHELTSDPSAFILSFDVDTEELDHTPAEVLEAINSGRRLIFNGYDMETDLSWEIYHGVFLHLFTQMEYPNTDYEAIRIKANLEEDTWIEGEVGPISHMERSLLVDFAQSPAEVLRLVRDNRIKYNFYTILADGTELSLQYAWGRLGSCEFYGFKGGKVYRWNVNAGQTTIQDPTIYTLPTT